MRLTSHTNTQGEFIEIIKSPSGAFEGEYVLVLHDDSPSTTKAYHLLDSGTASWLMKRLSMLFPEEKEKLASEPADTLS